MPYDFCECLTLPHTAATCSHVHDLMNDEVCLLPAQASRHRRRRLWSVGPWFMALAWFVRNPVLGRRSTPVVSHHVFVVCAISAHSLSCLVVCAIAAHSFTSGVSTCFLLGSGVQSDIFQVMPGTLRAVKSVGARYRKALLDEQIAAHFRILWVAISRLLTCNGSKA